MGCRVNLREEDWRQENLEETWAVKDGVET